MYESRDPNFKVSSGPRNCQPAPPDRLHRSVLHSQQQQDVAAENPHQAASAVEQGIPQIRYGVCVLADGGTGRDESGADDQDLQQLRCPLLQVNYFFFTKIVIS